VVKGFVMTKNLRGEYSDMRERGKKREREIGTKRQTEGIAR
jgi:hypothetical protein